MKLLYKIPQVILTLFGVCVVAIFLLGLRLLWGPVDVTSLLFTVRDAIGLPEDISFQKAFITYKGVTQPLYIEFKDLSFGKEKETTAILKKVEVALNYKELLTGHTVFEHVYIKNPQIFLQEHPDNISKNNILDPVFLSALLKNFPEVTIETGAFSYTSQDAFSIGLPQYTLSLHQDKNTSLIIVELQAPLLKLENSFSFFAKDLHLKGTYNPEEHLFSLEKSTFSWMDKVIVHLEGQFDLRHPDKGLFDIKGETEEAALSVFPDIWPSFLAPSPRTWIIENLSVGKVAKADLHAQGTFSFADYQIVPSLLEGTLDLEDITVDYLTGLPPVEHVYGKATYTDQSFDIKIKKGVLSNIEVVDGFLLFSQLDTDEEQAHINLVLQGPLNTVLWVIDHPPLSYPTKMGLQPDTFDGQANVNLTLDFPLLKDLSLENIEVQAKASLQDLAHRRDLLGTQLSFSQGKGDLAVTKEKMVFKATGNLEGIPSSLTWKETFKTSDSLFTLHGVYPVNILEKMGVEIPQEAKGSFNLTLRLHKSEILPLEGTVEADLTQAAFSVPVLQWTQKIGQKATSKIVFSLPTNKDLLEVNSITLTAADIALKGAFSFDTKKKTLLKADFPLFNTPLGKVSLALNTTNASLYTINVEGSSLDLSSFLEENKEESSEDKGSFTLKAKVDALYLRKDHPIKETSLKFEKKEGRIKKLLLHGTLGDKKSVEILFGKRPSKEGEILRIQAFDAGEFLRTIDLYDDIEGGILQVEGTRQENSPEAFLEGKATLKEFRLKETPVIAKVLSLASLQGISDILEGKGVYFKSAKLIFKVNDKTLQIYKGLAKSTATGVSIEGTVDRIQKTLSLKGTIIPVYVLNAFISNIPLLGDILSGGAEKGFWATSFSVTGSSSDPKISVNPLSALTPGFLRNIFGM